MRLIQCLATLGFVLSMLLCTGCLPDEGEDGVRESERIRPSELEPADVAGRWLDRPAGTVTTLTADNKLEVSLVTGNFTCAGTFELSGDQIIFDYGEDASPHCVAGRATVGLTEEGHLQLGAQTLEPQ